MQGCESNYIQEPSRVTLKLKTHFGPPAPSLQVAVDLQKTKSRQLSGFSEGEKKQRQKSLNKEKMNEPFEVGTCS